MLVHQSNQSAPNERCGFATGKGAGRAQS